jgi:hypothetical protein
MDTKAIQTIETRQQKEKQLLIEQLKKTPIVQVACEKVGVGRATFYRWKKEDSEFAMQAEIAIEEGAGLVNDMAESQLMAAIRDQNLTAIIFWLKNHHPTYANKVEITTKTKREEEILSPEQEAVLKKALQLASFLPDTEILARDEENPIQTDDLQQNEKEGHHE